MKHKIKLLDLFSGIGGFALGLKNAGFDIVKHQFSEIDKYAIANYKYNFKDAEYMGSITDVRGQRGQADVITFGTPCQDFSMAGKREGLEGQRSGLILEAIRLISEIQPSVFIWENVKGAFSSKNGADFWAILNAFTNIGGYRLEWQLLNTSWFLPQNRERIYLIGHLAGRSKPGVFPIGENDSLFNQSAKSKKRQSQTKFSSTINAKEGSRADSNFVIQKKSKTLTAGGHSGGLHSDMTVIPCLTPNRKEKRQNGRRFKDNGEPNFTLNCQDQHGVMIKQINSSKESGGKQPFQQNRIYDDAGILPALNSELGGRNNVAVNLKNLKLSTRRGTFKDNESQCLDAQCNIAVDNKKLIRRLTEIECERLQGFPDNWTAKGIFDTKEKTISKSQRFKLIGNAVTKDVVEAIGNKLLTQN